MQRDSKFAGTRSRPAPAAATSATMTAHPLKMRKQQLNLLKEYFRRYEEESINQATLVTSDSDSDTPQKVTSSKKMDIKHFSRVLSKIVQRNQEEIEEELKQLSLGKMISYQEFEMFHKEFIEELYTNPSHPLDMQLSQLNDIRKEFEEAATRAKDKNSFNEGMPIDGFSQILSRKMNLDPSRIQKFLKRTAFFNSITWIEFQSMLDKESTIREELLDWFMHKVDEEETESSAESVLSLQYRDELFLKPLQRTSQRNFVIEYLLEARIGKKPYFITVFDEATIALYHAETFESALEFVIPQDPSQPPPVPLDKSKRNRSTTAATATGNRPNDNSPESPKKKMPMTPMMQRTQTFSGTSPKESMGTSGEFSCFSPLTKHNTINTNHETSQSTFSPLKLNKLNQSHILSPANVKWQANPPMSPAKFRLKNRMQPAMSTFSGQKKRDVSAYDAIGNSEFSLSEYQQSSPPPSQQQRATMYTPEVKSVQRMRSVSHYVSGSPEGVDKSPASSPFRSPFMKQNVDKGEFYSEKSHRIRLMSVSNAQTATTFGQRSDLKREMVPNSEDHHIANTSMFASIRGGLKRRNEPSVLGNPASLMSKNSIIPENSPMAAGDWLNISPDKLRKNDRGSMLIKSFQEDSFNRIEDDPELPKVIKAYLTTDVKDEEDKKKIQVSFEQFYSMYKRDPLKYTNSLSGMMMTTSPEFSKTITREQEEYLRKDEETKENLRRLWKKFHHLPREYSIGYAKAVNEIIAEKILKNVNFDNLKMFCRKSHHSGTNQAAPRSTSVNATAPSRASRPIIKKQRLPSNWKSDIGKKYLKDLKVVDEHINLNPWTSEWRKHPETLMPTAMKEYQNALLKGIDDKAADKLRTGGLKRVVLQSEQVRDELASGADLNEGRSEEASVTRNRNNRMKTFSIEYLNELNLLAVGMINRQVQLYCAGHDKQSVFVKKVHSHQFNDIVIQISFRLNVVTQKWNIALLFENDVLRIFEFTLASETRPRILTFEHFFSYEFKVEIDKMAMFSEFGFVLTSYRGEFFVFQDHLTSSNSSDEVKSVPQYYLDQEKKLHENGVALSITAIACSEASKILIFGTSKGKIAFYEVKTKGKMKQKNTIN